MRPEVYFDDKIEVLRIKVVGEFSREELAESITSIKQMLKSTENRNILADITDSARVLPPKEDRKSMVEMAKDLDWHKIAVVGADPVLRITSKVILAVMGKYKEARFFKTEDEALAWLKGD